ncbi:MAG: Fe-S cluster assembly protein SufD [Flavobacteriales bacterium]
MIGLKKYKMDLKEQLITSYTSLENSTTHPHLLKLRKEAIKTFKEKGFPTIHDEEWKYTSLRNVLKTSYKVFSHTNSIDKTLVSKYLLDDLESYTLVFVNGIFSPDFSTILEEDIVIQNISSALKDTHYQNIISNHLGSITSKKDSFSALNTSYAKEGLFVYVPKGKIVNKTVQVLYLYMENTFNQPRNLIVAEDCTEIKIFEQHKTISESAVFTNAVTEIVVGKEAHVQYYKIQNDQETSSLVDNTFIAHEEKSTVSVYTFSFNGNIVRNNLNFYHKGEFLESNMYGISFLKGDTLVDNHTLIKHQVPNCESNELYKSIYDENSKGVFNGKVLVNKIAQKTNAYQQNDNVLLSENASIDTKPQLEIFADDVLCSHGCTVGQLDETGLFYLRQRGIPEKEAKALLLFAFTSEVMEKVTVDPIKNHVNKIISERLHVDLEF